MSDDNSIPYAVSFPYGQKHMMDYPQKRTDMPSKGAVSTLKLYTYIHDQGESSN